MNSHQSQSTKLLILTQVMDKKSSTLGFMTRWVEELSKQYQSIVVICLYAGEYTPPANVRVISLGKEAFEKKFLEKNSLGKKIITRIKYLARFYRFIFAERNHYDKVFVHMNDEYVILGGMFWKILGKKIYLWNNHYSGGLMKELAGKLCEKVFYTSKFSYTANTKKFPNGMQMPVGVDVESLKKGEVFEVPENSLLFLARLDPSKKPEIILKALKRLKDEGVSFTMDFVGGTSVDKFPTYEADVKKLCTELGLDDKVRFVGAVPSTETYKYYLSHDIYINVAKSGMLDKTIFKGLAAGCLPITTSIDFNEMIGEEFMVLQDNVDSLVEKLNHAISLSKEEKKKRVKTMQDLVIGKHSLDTLVKKISQEV